MPEARADRAVNPVRGLPVILRALADLEEELIASFSADGGLPGSGRARGRQRVRS